MTTTAKRPRKPPTTTRLEYVLEARGGYGHATRWAFQMRDDTREGIERRARLNVESWRRAQAEGRAIRPVEYRIVTRRVTVETVAVEPYPPPAA